MTLDLVTFQQTLTHLVTIPSTSPIAVAVSGGPDSMVLCHLLSQIFPRITALIVNHGLRPESTAEAELTQENLTRLAIHAEILTWKGEKPTTRIQESARHARHQLLQQWSTKNGVLYLFIAHHRDDQWETLYMRQCQSSGHRGMQGIPALAFQHFGVLIRPLLTWSKQQILSYAANNKIPYVNDSSNLKLTYERGRIRTNRADIERHFPLEKIQGLMETATQTYKRTTQDVTRFIRCHVTIHPHGVMMINQTAFQSLSITARHDLIQRLCQSVTDYPYPMSKAKIDRLVSELMCGRRCTLGGWLFSPRQKTIMISREQRALTDLRYVHHKVAPPLDVPSYVFQPNSEHWILFKRPLT
ncbi:MAG: tRNA lysidine(34) synthetase TilS [Candidatus Paracaedibacteraceae bacterium]|nr:tRNA lysidine(34) synthetase TilS [Candidatus Paracaedibacteraceae bacterium]